MGTQVLENYMVHESLYYCFTELLCLEISYICFIIYTPFDRVAPYYIFRGHYVCFILEIALICIVIVF